MPRKSAEQRGAELYRIGNKPPGPPDDLSPMAGDLWKRIAVSKPADWWTPALCILLRSFCETSEHSRRVVSRLAELPVGDPEALALGRQLTSANASLAGLAAKMRLSAQNVITPHSRAQMSERGPALDDELIGTRLRQ